MFVFYDIIESVGRKINFCEFFGSFTMEVNIARMVQVSSWLYDAYV